MATCKDCLHFDVCKYRDEKVSIGTKVGELVSDDFTCFKNKDDFAEVKHGEWENYEIPHMIRCSECSVSDLGIHRSQFIFCPYCGAKMDGKKGK